MRKLRYSEIVINLFKRFYLFIHETQREIERDRDRDRDRQREK